jgi:colanic acid biosynthesis glycosyl transferase WcaI
VGPFDVIVAVVPALASALAARSLASRLQVPYAVIVQDLVGKAAAQSGIRGGGPVAGAVGWAERRALLDAAAVATVSRPMARTVEAYGVPSERIAYLPNYTHIDMPVISRPEARRRLGWSQDTFIALHTGNMGFKQDLDNVVEAARLNAGQGRLEFVLMGDGNQRRHLEALAAGIPGIRFIDSMSEDDYPLALAAADVLLVNERPTVDDMCLPSKLTSYLVARRPIVAAVPMNGATAGLVGESRGGLVLPPSSPGELRNSLLALMSDPVRCEELGELGNVYAQTTLTRDRGLAATRSFVVRAAEGA